MSQEEKLEKFIRRIGQPGTGYTSFVLVQVLSSRGESMLRKFDLPEHGIDEARVTELAAEVFVTATEDADGHLGLSSYCLYGMKGVAKHERSPVIRLRSQNGDTDGSLEDTEPATVTGVTAQLMRHLEATQRNGILKDEIYARATSEIIRSQNERIAHYEKSHWETVLRAEELANESAQRQLSRDQQVAKDKRLDDAFKTIKPLVPLLLSKWTGLPAGAKPEAQMQVLKQLMSNITPDMMTQIANILGPQSLALAELYMETHAETPEDAKSESSESPKH